MKLLLTLQGGYKRVMDRLLFLQSESLTFINAQYSALGMDLVLSGCAVTDNGNGTVNIAPGIIYLGGDSLRYAGGSNISADGSQAFVRGGAVTSYPSTFGDGSTKNIYSEVSAIVAAQTSGNFTQIKIGLTLYNLQQYIKDQVNAAEPKGTIKEIYDLDGTFAENFDDTGLGVTPRWIKWALDNGNHTGTPGTAGKVLIGVGVYTDPVSGLETTYNNGDTGGEVEHTLISTEIPPLSSADVFAATGGTAYSAIVTLHDSAGSLSSVAVNPGGGAAHNNMQPYVAIYRVIKIID